MQAIKCYLCLLSPVSAWKRKRVRVWQGGREWRTESAKDKNHCLLLLWPHACTPVWVDAFSPRHTRISNKATGLTLPYLPLWIYLMLNSSPPKVQRKSNCCRESVIFCNTRCLFTVALLFRLSSGQHWLNCWTIKMFSPTASSLFSQRGGWIKIQTSSSKSVFKRADCARCEPKASSLPSGGRLQ